MKLTFKNPKLNTAIVSMLLSSALFSCGGGGGSDSAPPPPVTPPPIVVDTTPDAFIFADLNNAALSVSMESNTIEVSGISTNAPISISGGEYKIGNGDYTLAAGTVSSGQSITVRVTTSALYATTTQATLTIGGINDAFAVTTIEEPAPSLPLVQINLDVKHSVGGIDRFDREKFITIHASSTENDWAENDVHTRQAPNADPDLMPNFMTEYDVYFGRETGGFSWHLRNLPEDNNRPGFVDEAATVTRGAGQRANYSNSTADKFSDARAFEHKSMSMITGMQQFPFYPEGDRTNNPVNGIDPWIFSTSNTETEPLGTATGHYAAHYLSNLFRVGSIGNGSPLPKYFEVMNEPLYPLVTEREGEANIVDPLEIFEFHNAVATEIRKVEALNNMLIGGYTVAFPDFDKDNFQRWEERDKLFIDTSADMMDFYAIHLYDFPCFSNSERYRRGSNMEATMDMLEAYSMIKLGEIKPVVVSEYGAAVHCENQNGWTASRNTLQTKAFNGILMGLMERPDVVLKTIPFVVVKAEWGRGTVPYGPRLLVQQFERDGTTEQTGDISWVYSDLIHFYELWKEVNGIRVDSWSTEADIMADAYVDGNVAYIILNNLEVVDTEFSLQTLGLNGNSISSVNIKHLKTDANQTMVMEETEIANLDNTLSLEGESIMVIKVSFNSPITIDQNSTESKHYATTYKQGITANQSISFTIDDVHKGSNGEAVLRLGLGRDHGKSLLPSVTINGNPLTVPLDFRGYDQNLSGNGRLNFFGVLEIPLPYEYLQVNNTVTVEFEDTGGFVSTAAIQAFSTTRALTRN